MLRYRKWNHRRVWVCAHNRKLESQEGLGVCSQQEAGITGGSGCVLRYRKWNHRRFWVCAQV